MENLSLFHAPYPAVAYHAKAEWPYTGIEIKPVKYLTKLFF
jgi:hypothetical protein